MSDPLPHKRFVDLAKSGPVLIRVRYPAGLGRVVLRTDGDWDRDVEPDRVVDDGTSSEFELFPDRPFVYFKPRLLTDSGGAWSQGTNYLAVGGASRAREIYPHFDPDAHCAACDLQELQSKETGVTHSFRVFAPPGYSENQLKRYPVLSMQDGQNLFFPEEAAYGKHWHVAEMLGILHGMSAIDRVLVVGIYPNDREVDYTLPGYEAYGRFLVDELKPRIDWEYRTLPGPEHAAVMGSSLGGVVSFYLAWEHPNVFGMAGCMSSTFGYRDDLRERVATEPRRPVQLYLDSGWPEDNFEVTRDLHALLVSRGFRDGLDVVHYTFPFARHDEHDWAMRSHVPYQYFFRKRPADSPCN